MRTIIIGSGPAAAGVALRLTREPGEQITVVDLGHRLEDERRRVVATLGGQPPQQWDAASLDLISAQPVASGTGALPQKRSYGSAYPFADVGQLIGVEADEGANASAVSGAYGGFSNVWGAQVMPFSRATFTTWPFSFDDLAPHYAAALREIPFAAESDDYESIFPLLAPAQPLPPLAPRSQAVLAAAARHRDALREAGVVVGRARLAFQARPCVRCGLCMTGCPYGLIYSAAQTFDRLIAAGKVEYRDRLLALHLAERGDGVTVTVRDQRTGRIERIDGDRVFVGAGAVGSTRLAFASLPAAPRSFEMVESTQFAVPFLSRRSVGDPRADAEQFTLNQVNLLLQFDDDAYTTSHVHLYPYNPALQDALPAPARHRLLSRVTGEALARLTVGLGYLPSWAAPTVRVDVGASVGADLPSLRLSGSDEKPLMLDAVLRRLRRIGRQLDLHPVTPAVFLSGPGKSYHFGGSFPHAEAGAPIRGALRSDRLGRPEGWSRIHLVDGSVLPSVPSTTFTLTVMANAHRIASEVLELEGGTR